LLRVFLEVGVYHRPVYRAIGLDPMLGPTVAALVLIPAIFGLSSVESVQVVAGGLA
jgi:hypothetical protein